MDPAKDLHDADPGPVVAEAMRAIREEREHRAGVRERVFGSREFFKLWLAQFVSALGDWLVESFVALKRAEWERYEAAGETSDTDVTPWEIEYYLPFF